MDKFTNLLVFLFLIINCINAQGTDEGDNCFGEIDGARGECRLLEQCPSAIAGLRRNISPQVCSFLGYTSVVCCFDTDTLRTEGSASSPRFDVKLSVGGCSLSADAIYNGNEIGGRARSQCQAIVDTISKCGSVFDDCPRGDKLSKTEVVGGEPAYTSEFPHMALLGFGKSPASALWICGGSLISNRWVMTAAHCLFSASVNSEVKYVRLGVDKLSEPQNDILFTIASIVEHPGRNPPVKYNDIALLQLDREVILGPAIIPACLITGDEYIDGGVITGWGVTKPKGEQSDTLQKVTLYQVAHEDCQKAHPPSSTSINGIVNDTQICFGRSALFQDSCQGDSGGPIQTSNYKDCIYSIIGIVSTGKGCATPGIPGIYTRVTAYIPWIEDIVWPRRR